MSDTDHKSMWSEDQRDIVQRYVAGTLRSFDSSDTPRVVETILDRPLPTDSLELQWLRAFLMESDLRKATVDSLRRAVHVIHLISADNILLPSAPSEDGARKKGPLGNKRHPSTIVGYNPDRTKPDIGF